MIPLNKVKDLISRHVSLEAELSSGKIDKKKFAEKSKEYSDLNNIVKEAKAYSNYENEKNELNKIINDNRVWSGGDKFTKLSFRSHNRALLASGKNETSNRKSKKNM